MIVESLSIPLSDRNSTAFPTVSKFFSVSPSGRTSVFRSNAFNVWLISERYKSAICSFVIKAIFFELICFE